MTLIVDLIIVGIIALCAILGYFRGLTKSLLKIVSFVLALVIAFVLFKPISLLIINHTQIDDNIQKAIEEKMVGFVDQTSGNVEEAMRENSSMPEVMTKYIQEAVAENKGNTEEAAKQAAKSVADIIINAGTWILVFILARVILIFAKSILELIVKLPVIKQMDKIGGVFYGILEGLVIIYVAFAILSFVSPMFDSAEVLSAVNKAAIGGQIYNNNIILKLIF